MEYFPPPKHPAPPRPLHSFADCPPDVLEINRTNRQRQIDQQASVDEDPVSNQRSYRPPFETGDGRVMTFRPPMILRADTTPVNAIPQIGNFAALPAVRAQGQIFDLLQAAEDEAGSKIPVETVQNLLSGRYDNQFDRYYIIDCRFEYEYRGGHIRNAINILPDECEEKLQKMFMDTTMDHRVVIVFHCEFSTKRGPNAWKCLRRLDRQRNLSNYPHLSYPYVYVMEGGYKDFWNRYPAFCRGGYIEMKDKRYFNDLQENLRKSKNKKTSHSFTSINTENIAPTPAGTRRLPNPLSRSMGLSRCNLRDVSSSGDLTSMFNSVKK